MVRTMTPLAFLSSPYQKYPLGHQQAYIDVSAISGHLLKAGVMVYSPIAHSHSLALHGDIDPHDMLVWMQLNAIMMEKCDILIVAHMPGWDKSEGIKTEVKYFEVANKPIYDLDIETLLLVPRRKSDEGKQIGLFEGPQS